MRKELHQHASQNIHETINSRSWTKVNTFNPDKEHEIDVNIVSALSFGEVIHAKWQTAPKHYCHECSSSHGRPVYHKDAPTTFELGRLFTQQTREKLQEMIDQVIWSDQPYFKF